MSKTTSRILSAIFSQLRSRPALDDIGIEQYRKLLERSAMAFKPDISVKVEPIHINNIKAQWLIPLNPKGNRIIMYVHGGGFIAGSIKSHQDLATRIAIASESRVLIFNYALAPENPFPKGLEDVKAVYQWLIEKYSAATKINLIGDSAGGGLSLALLADLLNKTLPLPVCSVLISPWIDLECNNTSIIENAPKDPMLSPSILKTTARLYTNKGLANALISPINNDFSGICPILIQAGEHEILIDDSKILAKKLKKTGAHVELEIWEEMFHVWHYFSKYLPEGRKAIDNIGNFIKKHS
jgi:monoterpene epsilon-lactone hydrolase